MIEIYLRLILHIFSTYLEEYQITWAEEAKKIAISTYIVFISQVINLTAISAQIQIVPTFTLKRHNDTQKTSFNPEKSTIFKFVFCFQIA